MTNEIKGFLLYQSDLSVVNDDILNSLVAVGINSIFLVVKDYNGSWIDSKKEQEIDEWIKKYSLKKFAWICTQTEGYEGELTNKGINSLFEINNWSVRDNSNIDSIRKPVPGDFGIEQFACPSNDNHNKYVIENIQKIKSRYDGLLFDFVRFPLQSEYCFCDSCEKLSNEIFKKSVYKLDPHEKFLLKQKSIVNLVNKLENEIDIYKSFLIWPSFKLKNLSRYQAPELWKAENVSPMLYHTLGNEAKMYEKFKKKYHKKNILPLFLVNDINEINNKKLNGISSNYIITHYGLNKKEVHKKRNKLIIYFYDLFKDAIFRMESLKRILRRI